MHALASLTPVTRQPPRIVSESFRRDQSERRPISFRHFVLVPATRTLLHRGRPVEIGGRAFDLLLVLLRARGAIVSKAEIMRHVWPSIFVDEGNLRFQMAMLRKALGEDRDLIKTVTGRGYLVIDERDGF